MSSIVVYGGVIALVILLVGGEEDKATALIVLGVALLALGLLVPRLFTPLAILSGGFLLTTLLFPGITAPVWAWLEANSDLATGIGVLALVLMAGGMALSWLAQLIFGAFGLRLRPTVWDILQPQYYRPSRHGWILGEIRYMPAWLRPLDRVLTWITGDGRWKRRIAARRGPVVKARPGTHHIVIAGSGRGKSQTLIAAMLAAAGGVIVTDPKGEIYEATSRYRARKGRLWVVGPDWAAQPWPISAMFGSTEKAAEALMAAAMGRTGADQAPFLQPYGMALKALLADAKRQGKAAPWLEALNVGEVATALRAIAEEPDHPGQFAANQALNAAKSDRYWGSILGTAAQFTGPLKELAPALDAGKSGPDLARDTVYLQLPATIHPDSPAAVIVRWLLDGLWHWALAHPPAAKRGHCWFVVDEAGILKPALLPNMVAFGRSAGIGAVAYAQSLAQLESAYGRDTVAGLLAGTNGSLTIWPSSNSQAELQAVAGRLEVQPQCDNSFGARVALVMNFAQAGGWGFYMPVEGLVHLISPYPAHAHMKRLMGTQGPVKPYTPQPPKESTPAVQPEAGKPKETKETTKAEEFL